MEATELISGEYLLAILTGILMGTSARVLTLVVDYRQTPSYPDGKFIQMVAGFVASALGAVAIPALLEKNYAAFTFLAMGVQHFRDIRKMEADSLENQEGTGFARRGAAYIDGIAKTYEAKNYLSLLASLVTVSVMLLLYRLPALPTVLAGVLAGLASIFLLKRLTRGRVIGDFCDVRPAQIRVEGSELYVEDLFVCNTIGTAPGQRLIREEGLAVMVIPKSDSSIMLHNGGQRQAMLYEAASSLGVKRYQFTRRSFGESKVALVLVPMIRDMDRLIAAVKNTPILENSRKLEKVLPEQEEN